MNALWLIVFCAGQNGWKYHLVDEDLKESGRFSLLVSQIERLKDRNISVVLHMPLGTNKSGRYGMLATRRDLVNRFYHHAEILAHLSCCYRLPIVFHPMTGIVQEVIKLPFEEQTELLLRAFETFERRIGLRDMYWFENVLAGPCSFKNPYLPEVFEQTQAKMVLDTSHALISLSGDNEKVFELWDRLDPHIRYFHLVDSMGQTHDALLLFEGVGDIEGWMKRIGHRPYILEIMLSNQDFAVEMEESYLRLKRALDLGFDVVKRIYAPSIR